MITRNLSQVPFTSINFGRDTSIEGRLISKWILNASIEGIGKHNNVSIFPISIFSYKHGVNADPGDPNYDLKKLAIESLSRRIYPNFANGDFSEAHENPEDPETIFATMGCRTLIGYDINGLGYKRVGRGNIAPCTIILPKLGIEYGICTGKRDKADLDGFWKALDEILEITKISLLDRYELISNQHPKSGEFMYVNGTMKGSEDCTNNVAEAMKHGTLAIGYLGLAEMCQALFGKNHAEDTEVYKFAYSVIEYINQYAKKCTQTTHLNFSCYATPAESLCHTAANMLRKQYGPIYKVCDKEYITNSHHVPVWEHIGIYDKIKLEAPFAKLATGGCILYVELDSTFIHNTDAIEKIIDYAFSPDINASYLAFNFPLDTCQECGYKDEINDKCPQCGSDDIRRLRRVTGYLTTDYSKFNKGKIAEVNDRFKHSTMEKF